MDPRAPPLPAPPVKKKRASRPKVRTACLTCKIRRVKCDERKPTCARCHKADVECDGYFAKTEETAASSTTTAADPCHSSSEEASQPRGTHQRHHHRPIRPRTGMPPSLLGVPLLEGLDVDLWSRIVLEAGMRDDRIRHCILAVGALAMAVAEVPASANDEPLRGGRPSVLAPWTHKQIVNDHHRHALRHHLRAVAGFRQSFQDPTTLSPRCVHLMTLILIFDEIVTETLELFSDDDDDKDGAGGNPSLTLGEGVASPLFFALRSCRDRAVRTRAAHAVGRIPWRDSGFDAQAMIVGKLGAVVMEEAARDADGFIPAEARWFWMGGEWHVGKRAVVATYVRHAPDELGRQITKQLTLGVDDWGNICRLAGCVSGRDS
ncbi:hypothetical protein VdG1_08045 [Verticillium dahliae VDG1]|nr:hypothetical protein VdG1_08045 [Verticillium dahliae VDG1]